VQPADAESRVGGCSGFVEVLLSVTNSSPTSINSSRSAELLLEVTADIDDSDLTVLNGGVDTTTHNSAYYKLV